MITMEAIARAKYCAEFGEKNGLKLFKLHQDSSKLMIELADGRKIGDSRKLKQEVATG